MDGWSKLSSGLAGLNIGQSANKFAKGYSSSVQATRERLGQVSQEEITELPQGAPRRSPIPPRPADPSHAQSTRISRRASTPCATRTSCS